MPKEKHKKQRLKKLDFGSLKLEDALRGALQAKTPNKKKHGKNKK
jgi:hypothetical protein